MGEQIHNELVKTYPRKTKTHKEKDNDWVTKQQWIQAAERQTAEHYLQKKKSTQNKSWPTNEKLKNRCARLRYEKIIHIWKQNIKTAILQRKQTKPKQQKKRTNARKTNAYKKQKHAPRTKKPTRTNTTRKPNTFEKWKRLMILHRQHDKQKGKKTKKRKQHQ